MKTFYISTFLFFFVSQISAQDTISVQTFTWDSTSRSAIFSFPEDPDQSFRKIIMEYNMRCHDAAVGNGDVGCGEWDYHCNTVITDPSAQDSAKAKHPSHIISDFEGESFDFSINPTYSYTEYLQKNVEYLSSSNETESTYFNDNSNSELGTISADTKLQFLIPADSLTTSGISPGAINGIKLFFKNEQNIPFLRIRLKLINTNQQFEPQLDGLTQHYFKTTNVSEGENHFKFYEAFNWDGISSIMIELSHSADDQINMRLEGMPIDEAYCFSSIKEDYYVNFQGADFFNLEPSIFNDTDSILTISMWTRGDERLPINTTLFEAIDDESRRQANVHLPWSNAQIYWDCGNDGSNYDRINKPALEPDFESVWTHWTFVKNINQLSMTILKNGQVWHTEFGKSKPIDITKFTLGSSTNLSAAYYGDIDDVRIWNQDVDPFTIRQWMYETIGDDHPYHDFLIADFSFDEKGGNSISGSLTNSIATSEKDPNWRKVRGKDLRKDFKQRDLCPKTSLVQGEYSMNIEEIPVLDSIINSTHRVVSYAINNNQLEAVDTLYYYNGSASPIFNEEGTLIRSISNTIDGTIDINQLDYYRFWDARYEILSFITPYGNGLDLGPEGVTFTIDMSDYATILKGDKMMSIEGVGNRQEELDIKFHFITGQPHAKVREIKQIWPIRNANQVWSGYSIGNIINDDVLEPRQIFIPDDIGYVKLRSAVTGHGSNGEFQSRQHYINVNGGFEEAIYSVWKECADNPVYPQGGTWIFDRAGWCPGMETDVFTYEIGPFLNKGEYNEFDYGIMGGNASNMDYRVNNQLVLFDEPFNSNDVEIMDILNPSSKTEHQRFNPSCNLPNIIIRNAGSQLLQSCDITYGMEEGQSITTNWTGNLRYLDTKKIELEVNDESFWKSGNGNFYVTLSNPNGEEDENPANSSMKSKYTAPFTSGKDLRVDIRTDNKPQDTRINIYDSKGDVVLDLFGFGSNTNYSLDLDLPDGCYTMEVIDLSDDGLEFWFFAGNGTGWLRIAEDNIPIISFDPDFGGNLYFDFIINKTNSINPIEFAQSIGISPNPADETLSVHWTSQLELKGKYKILDQNGRILLSQNAEANGVSNININHLPNGIYFIIIESDLGITSKKFIKM